MNDETKKEETVVDRFYAAKNGEDAKAFQKARTELIAAGYTLVGGHPCDTRKSCSDPVETEEISEDADDDTGNEDAGDDPIEDQEDSGSDPNLTEAENNSSGNKSTLGKLLGK